MKSEIIFSALILTLFITSVKADNSLQVDECIVEGSHVQLMGMLLSENPPKNTLIKNKLFGSWVLNTDKAYCGEGYNEKTKTLSRLEEGCSRFQLKLSLNQYFNHRDLLGKSVIVRGTIIIAKTEQIYPGMLIDVSNIELESEQ
ncbi:MAG: hypothetical protein H0U70_05530 [Tatlockia sp.]|nr:hypothetical protein [Tatlockia sp.]